MRCRGVFTGLLLAGWFGGAPATAQTQPPKIWDLKLGQPVSALPADDYVDPACGTNGGPPARVLKNFAEFGVCPIDRATGLHEVWFRYDDEMEYVARARRSDIMIRQYQANSLAGQPIITSLLIDDAGTSAAAPQPARQRRTVIRYWLRLC